MTNSMYALWVHARDISNQADADAVIARALSAGITDVLFQVIDDYGRARYRTSLFTVSPDIGTFDPLAYLSTRIATHAWLCVGFDVLRAHPEYNAVSTKSLDPSVYPKCADFTLPECRQFCRDWVASILADHPNTGIHLDYLRWANKYGGDKLPWATTTAITQAYNAIAAAVPNTPLTAAVAWSPLGLEAGSMQAWGEWMSTLDVAFIMAYPPTLARLQYIMAKSNSIPKAQVGVGLSGLDFDVTPNTRIDTAILADCVTWAKSAGYQHFSWFDYTKLDAEQYAVAARFAPKGGVMGAVDQLTTIAADLQASAGRLESEAAMLRTKANEIAEIAAGMASLDTLAAEVAQEAQRLSDGL